MKLVLPLLLSVLAITGCSSSDGGNDAGSDGSSSDATTNGDSASDATASDAPSDAPADVQHGNLDAGEACDLNNDNCGPGLKCCTGGAVQPDASVGHCIVPTDAGTCPLVP